MAADEPTATLADRMAITDVVVRYFELVDAKGWDHMHEVFTDDTTTRWTPDSLVEGRDNIVGAMQHMIGSDEIVTYHHVASMAPVVDGDRADVTVRVRAMHHGVGSRAGQFYESLGVQPTRLVRTPRGMAHRTPRVADRGEARRPGGAVRTGDRRGQAVLTRMTSALTSLHPRVSLNSICSMHQSLDEDLALWADLGVDHVGLITPKFDAPGWDAGAADGARRRAARLERLVLPRRDRGLAGVHRRASIPTILYVPPGRRRLAPVGRSGPAVLRRDRSTRGPRPGARTCDWRWSRPIRSAPT